MIEVHRAGQEVSAAIGAGTRLQPSDQLIAAFPLDRLDASENFGPILFVRPFTCRTMSFGMGLSRSQSHRCRTTAAVELEAVAHSTMLPEIGFRLDDVALGAFLVA